MSALMRMLLILTTTTTMSTLMLMLLLRMRMLVLMLVMCTQPLCKHRTLLRATNSLYIRGHWPKARRAAQVTLVW